MNRLPALLELRLSLLKNGFKRIRRRSRLELPVLVFFFLAAAGGLFLFFYFSFRFFRGQEPFGPILIDETFFLFNFALFCMLVTSSSVSAYTSLFRSPEVPFLMTRPVTWMEIYFMKFGEALWYSSWAFLFVALPFMAAYGLAKSTSAAFPFLCLVFYLPMILLAGMLGTLAAILAIWFFPSRARRRTALILVIVAAALFFFKSEPQIVKEQGSIAGVMSGYLPHVAFAKNGLLPSSWVTRGILAASRIETRDASANTAGDGLFYFLLLLSNSLFFLIPSYSASQRLYPKTYLRAQDHNEVRKPGRVRAGRTLEKFFDGWKWPTRPAMAFLEKDIKTFLRDPAEWSQLIIFFGLLLLYFANLRNLEFHVLKDFWKNLVFVLNTIGTYVVLSSFSMRFVFPMLSLEGSRYWMIGMAPIRFSSLLLGKFLLGTAISLILTLPLVFLSGWMLEVSRHELLFTVGLGFFVCTALTGLSVGLGAKFINLKSNNPAEIISGFGGSMLLVSHLSYLAFVGTFLFLSHESHTIILGTLAAASLLIGIIPIKIGVLAFERMEF